MIFLSGSNHIVMALLNNFLELRSDAFKITVHHRRPVPQRTDTIGPWLDALTFLTWLGALTNAALVYLFHPQSGYIASHARNAEVEMKIRMCAAAGAFSGELGVCGVREEGSGVGAGVGKTGEPLMTALLVALAASHGAILMRAVVRHVVRRAVWTGCEEVRVWEKEVREVKERFLRGVGGVEGMARTGGEGVDSVREVDSEARDKNMQKPNGKAANGEHGGEGEGDPTVGFWDNDEGLEEIMRISKEV
jgi:anoctamin-10